MTPSIRIHPSAVVSPDAELGEGCRVEPFAIIEAGASLGRENRVGPWVRIAAGSRIDDGNHFSPHCCIGGDPQDLHFDPDLATGVAIHQFCRVGRCAMIGAYSKIVQDVLPVVLVDGHPAKVRGANVTGLRRRGFTAAQRGAIRRAVKAIYHGSHTPRWALEYLREQSAEEACIGEMVALIEQSERGIV